MRKFTAIILVISVLCFAGAAFAHNRNNNRSNNVQPANCEFYGDFAGHHRGQLFAPDMPKEIREKTSEIAKLYIDLDEALSSNPLNKEKAREVYGKIIKLQQDVNVWEFEKYLDNIEQYYRQPQPPAPDAPEAN